MLAHVQDEVGVRAELHGDDPRVITHLRNVDSFSATISVHNPRLEETEQHAATTSGPQTPVIHVSRRVNAPCHGVHSEGLMKRLTKPMKAVATPVEIAVAATTLLDGMPVFVPEEAPDKISGLRNRM